MFEIIGDILEWTEAILTLLSGGMVFNLLAIFLGLIPWFVSLLLWCAFEGKRLSKHQALIFGNATAGLIVAAADLAYRQYFNNDSTLRDVANWISPFRGGQFMFLPLWLLGITTTALAASCL